MIAEADLRRIDRRIGWIMSLGGALLVLGQSPVLLTEHADYPAWWHVGVGALAGLVLVLTAIGWKMPHRALAVAWRAAPAAGAVLVALSFAGHTGGPEPDQVPWIMVLHPTLGAYLLLWLNPWLAAAGSVFMALLLPASALVFTGAIPHVVLAALPLYLSNVVFIALFVGIRSQMVATRSATRAAEEGLARETRATVAAEHREQVSRMLHDEVISVLTAAFRTRGIPSSSLRGAAEGALALLSAPVTGPVVGVESGRAAVARIVEAARSVAPDCRVEASAADGEVPVAVTDALIGAANEALRNSLRHAGAGVTRTVGVHADAASLRVTVADDGPGFTPEHVPPGSLGISRSIHGRLRGIPGGSSAVDSRPGGPTVVSLEWRA